MPRFVLLDRDGVINRRIVGGYVTCWEKFVFLPGALEGLRLLAEKNYHPIVVSNQAGVGKGLMTAADLQEITRRFLAQVEAQGGRIHGVYYCTHRAEDDCQCRKPKPGLLLNAQAEHHFAFEDTFLIGDSESDLLAAQAVGCPAIMVSNTPSASFEKLPYAPRVTVPSLLAAAEFLVSLKRCYNSPKRGGQGDMIREYFLDYCTGLSKALESVSLERFEEFVHLLENAYQDGRQVFFMGNGGSGSTASHFACDLNKGVSYGRQKRFRVISLNDNVPTLTAYANDVSYENVFVEQLRNFLRPGDLVVGISGSGNSPNVLKAISYANGLGAHTVGLCGFNGGKLAAIVRTPLLAPVHDMQKAEDVHMILLHVVMQLLCAHL
jgi:D-sedoheptulose 7-phosphate isomerase